MLPVVVILFSFLCGCGTRSPQPVLEPVNGTLAEEEEPSDKSPDNPEDAAGKEPASASNTGGQEKDDSRRTLTVHVCGAVKKEGVYSLPEGSRIRDAIEAAGGFDKDADTSFLNLAMKLEDSWQIRVPTVGEAEKLRQDGENGKTEGAVLSTADMDSPGITRGPVSGEDTLRTDAESGSSSAEVRRVNINTASVEELMEIPGIGESKAKKIIEYREIEFSPITDNLYEVFPCRLMSNETPGAATRETRLKLETGVDRILCLIQAGTVRTDT